MAEQSLTEIFNNINTNRINRNTNLATTVPTGELLPNGTYFISIGDSQLIPKINTNNNNITTLISTQKSRIDDILSGASANLNTFSEVVALINSVDTTNDQAFAGYATSNNLEISNIKDGTTIVGNSDKLDGMHASLTNTINTIVQRNSSGNAVGLGVATGTSFNNLTGISVSLPLANSSTALTGTSTLAARADHVHPSNFSTLVNDIKMDGTGSLGTLSTFPRADHVHPSDSSKINVSLLGAASGVATLDTNGIIPITQLPSYVSADLSALII